jgi:ATP-binding cassette subfamily F protein uup
LGLLLGRIAPDHGQVRLGTGLEITYFDQLREHLNEDKTVRENVTDGTDTIEINGRKRHVIGYLKDFLFPPDRANIPVRMLSGGERNRLLLAKLFTRPSNLLVLDEPTNDLDAETLELLEEVLMDYTGTVLMVSHDRSFLNNVVTSTLVFEGDGKIGEYVGGYDDWLQQRERPTAPPVKKISTPPARRHPKTEKKRKLTFNEERELITLPERIETMESEQAALFAEMGAPDFYRLKSDAVAATQHRLAELESALAAAYDRWELLDALMEKREEKEAR